MKGLKEIGLRQTAELKARTHKQVAMGRISTPDSTRVLHQIEQLEQTIAHIEEKE